MNVLDAFHLPDLEEADVESWRTLDRGGVIVRAPVLRAGALARMIARMRAARTLALESRTAQEIVAVIDRTTDLLLEEQTIGPLLDALPAVTGYSAAMARLVVERMAEDWRRPALERLLDAELAGGRALDAFVERPGRRAHSLAVGPPLTFHIFSGNVPGVAVTSMVRALLVRSAVLGKTASGEPLLAPLFARTLARMEPDMARCMAVLYWPGGADAIEDTALEEADAIIVYGSGETVRAIRRRAPERARVIEHGPRFSIGLVAREMMADGETAARVAEVAAVATAMFDQQGCVSPHMIWVEGDASAADRFARLLADALGRLAVTLPRGSIDPGSAAAVREARTAAEFRAIGGADVEVFTGPGAGTGWTVIREAAPEFRPSPLFRTISVQPLPRLEDAAACIVPWGASLQTVAVAASRERVVALAPGLARAGAMRVTDFERMPWPPADGHHDGSGALTELVRWVDLE